MASKYGARVEYTGPLFTVDVVKTFRQNARNLVEAIAEDGERMVQAMLPRSSVAPHYADFVEGRAKSLSGNKWALNAVVTSKLHLSSKGYKGYGAVLETTDSFQRRSRSGNVYTVQGFGKWIYRRVGNALKRGSRAARADLAKGLN